MRPTDTLLQWMRENPHDQSGRHAICTRLAQSDNMRFAWPSLEKSGAKPLQILGMVMDCLRESAQDVRRNPSKLDQKAISKVHDAAAALLCALQSAQILGEGSPFFNIGGSAVILSWTDDSAKRIDSSMGGFPSVGLPDLLRALQAECEDKTKHPPAKAIERQTNGRERSMIRAFVRRLSARFVIQFGAGMPENVSLIVCAIFEASITGRDVETILQDSPFKN